MNPACNAIRECSERHNNLFEVSNKRCSLSIGPKVKLQKHGLDEKNFFFLQFLIDTSGCVNAIKRHALRSTLIYVPETSWHIKNMSVSRMMSRGSSVTVCSQDFKEASFGMQL